MEPLHKVTKQELPIFQGWLEKHLPNTTRMHGIVVKELSGQWRGSTFYTLGWPEIRAAGEGPADESESKCPGFFNTFQIVSLFGPDPADVEELARREEFLDWSKPILSQAICASITDVLEKLSRETGTPYRTLYRNQLMVAHPGQIVPRPVPEGFEVRPIDPQLQAAYITSTWPHRRPHTEPYIRALVESFHSVGIFDRDGNLAAFELENECGMATFLHVKDEYRGLGLAKCAISLLAQKLFEENRPVLATIIESNKPSVALHESMGFKTIGILDWFFHSMTSDKVIESA